MSNTQGAVRILGERKDKEWGLKQQSPWQALGEGDMGTQDRSFDSGLVHVMSVRTTGLPPTRAGPKP